MSEPRPRLVWDLPTRLTHWLFVGCVALSWWTAEQRLMDWHRYSGYTMLGLLVFRIYWGIAGSSTARFARFINGPRAVLDYFRLPREQRVRVIGHTPLGSWSVVVLLLTMIVQVTLGLFATDIDGLESGPLSHLVSFEAGRAVAEAHELSFDVLIVLVAVHVVAVLIYFFYDRNNLTGPMLSGRKHLADAGPGKYLEMQRAPAWRLWTGVALATLVVWMIV
jgi:cytochrome b